MDKGLEEVRLLCRKVDGDDDDEVGRARAREINSSQRRDIHTLFSDDSNSPFPHDSRPATKSCCNARATRERSR